MARESPARGIYFRRQLPREIAPSRPGARFLPRSSHRFDSAMPLGQAVWLGPTCIVRTTSRVGPPLKSLRQNRSRLGAGSRARGRPVSRPGGLLNLGTPCPDISPLGNLRGPALIRNAAERSYSAWRRCAECEPLHIGDMAPVVFSWDARAHNPICYLRGALGDAGAAAASLRVATYRPHAGRQRTLTP